MNLLYPKVRLALVPAMLGHAALGALLAGLYGVVHDELTYSISPEYFTRLKFAQFHFANFGLPPRIFVAEIGFIAAAAAGLICGWFIARVTVPAFPREEAIRQTLRGFLLIFICALAGSITGYVFGELHGTDFPAWEAIGSHLGVTDLPAFVRVAYIHNGGYLGGFLGLAAAVIHLQKIRTRSGAIGAILPAT